MYDKEIAETYKEHMIFFVLKSLGIMLVTLGILLALPLLVGKESTGTEYTTYTQEVENIDVSNREINLVNGETLKLRSDDVSMLSVGDIITYKKAEGEVKIEEIKVVGHNDE